MARIIVFSDLHANLPALEATIQDVQRHGYDEIIHLGDAISIGPYPAECLERLHALPNASFVMGNHDAWLAHGLPQPQPDWMSDGELAHQRWTHAQVSEAMVDFVSGWPFQIWREVGGNWFVFQHYALDGTGIDFLPFMKHPTPQELDRLYEGCNAQVVFHGHTHVAHDLSGRRRYVNPGSIGCCTQALAHYCVIDFHRGELTIEPRAVPYDDAELYATFERRKVPERRFLYEAFFGGRFPVG